MVKMGSAGQLESERENKLTFCCNYCHGDIGDAKLFKEWRTFPPGVIMVNGLFCHKTCHEDSTLLKRIASAGVP